MLTPVRTAYTPIAFPGDPEPQTLFYVRVFTAEEWDLLEASIRTQRQARTATGLAPDDPQLVKEEHLQRRAAVARAISRIRNAWDDGDCLEAPEDIEAYLDSMNRTNALALLSVLTGVTDLRTWEVKASGSPSGSAQPSSEPTETASMPCAVAPARQTSSTRRRSASSAGSAPSSGGTASPTS